MGTVNFKASEVDLRMAEIYKDFLPEKIFDAHMHLYLRETTPALVKGQANVYFKEGIGFADYAADMGQLMPGVKEMRLNLIPMPDRAMNDLSNGMRDKINAHVLKEQETHPWCVASPYIMPGDSEETIYAMADLPGVRGLKCYFYAAGILDEEAFGIQDFLPEAAWVVANERKLPIILHIVKEKSLSDPGNISYITTMAKRYPNAQLVLAHCGQAFSAWTTVKSIKKLEDCGNIWFDFAAICESGPMIACILKNAGKRTMWGSDYPVCMHRGRAVSLGTGNQWLLGDDFKMLDRPLIAAENLMAFWQAVRVLDLDQTQINDLFYNNACRLFQIS